MASEGLSINSTNAEFGGGGDTETVVGVNRKVSCESLHVHAAITSLSEVKDGIALPLCGD